MGNLVEQHEKYTPIGHEKSKWVSKQNIPSKASQTKDVASTSHSIFSDLSTHMTDTLYQYLSQFSKQDF